MQHRLSPIELGLGESVGENIQILQSSHVSFGLKLCLRELLNMATSSRSVVSLFSASRHVRPRQGIRYAHRRTFASVAPGQDTLPLAGIRVLDMTRVLAGVSLTTYSMACISIADHACCSHIVRKFLEI